MCVIAVKPIGVKIDRDTVDKMWDSNPDGGGLAVMTQDETFVMKGYMDVEKFWNEIDALQDMHLVLHFRWATHGAKVPKFTHPFVVTRDSEIATSLNITTKGPVLFHNGVLSHYGSTEVSDTLDFTVNGLARMKSIRQMLKLLHSVGSKYTFIAEKKFWNIGGFEKYKGLEVSNTTFNRNSYYYGNHGNSVYQRQKWSGRYDRRDQDSILPVKTDGHEEGPKSLVVTEGTKESMAEETSAIILGGDDRGGTEVN